MKTRHLKAAMGLAASILPVSSAFAHNGDHGENIVATVMHWLGSPTHSLFAVLGGALISVVLIKSVRKKRI